MVTVKHLYCVRHWHGSYHSKCSSVPWFPDYKHSTSEPASGATPFTRDKIKVAEDSLKPNI